LIQSTARIHQIQFHEGDFFDFELPDLSTIPFCECKTDLELGEEEFGSHRFRPTVDCPFRPTSTILPVEIERPGYLYRNGRIEIGSVHHEVFGAAHEAFDLKSNNWMLSTPFDNAETLDHATVSALLFLRDRMSPEWSSNFNRSQEISFNGELSLKRQAEMVCHIFDRNFDGNQFELFWHAVNILAPDDLMLNQPFSKCFEKLFLSEKLVEIVDRSCEMFADISLEYFLFRPIRIGARHWVDGIADLECDFTLIIPAEFELLPKMMAIVDRHENEILMSHDELVTYMRKEMIFKPMLENSVIMCFFLPVSFQRPQFGIGFGFAIHFINHLFEFVKTTRRFAALFSSHFLLPIWNSFFATGKIPFDVWVAAWLTILFVPGLFNQAQLREYSKSCSADTLRRTHYHYFCVVASMVQLLAICYSPDDREFREHLTMRFVLNSGISFCAEFQRAIAADLVNPLGSHFPLFDSVFPAVTRALLSFVGVPQPLNIEWTVSSEEIPSARPIYTPPHSTNAIPVIFGYPDPSFCITQMASDNGLSFVLANPQPAKDQRFKIKLVRKSFPMTESTRGLKTNEYLAILRQTWTLEFEAICYFMNCLFTYFNCELQNFCVFRKFVNRIFPGVPTDAAVLEIQLTSYRFGRRT
jgi:hypothetical protein